jgi:sulfatase modifying factor 1
MRVLATRLLVGSLACAAAQLAHAAPKRPAVRTEHLRFHEPVRVRIEAGSFLVGASDGLRSAALALCKATGETCDETTFSQECPAHRVHLRAFAIDRREVSNAEYTRCVVSGACFASGVTLGDSAGGLPEHPVTQVSWHDAARYCRFVAGELPTEAQWERAARGHGDRLFPWGDEWKTGLAQQGGTQVAPVDASLSDRSPHGVEGLSGNVAELVRDAFAPYAPDEVFEPFVAPHGPRMPVDEVVLRGGSFRSKAHELRVTSRVPFPRDGRRDDVGFRCAYAVPAAPLPPRDEVEVQGDPAPQRSP